MSFFYSPHILLLSLTFHLSNIKQNYLREIITAVDENPPSPGFVIFFSGISGVVIQKGRVSIILESSSVIYK